MPRARSTIDWDERRDRHLVKEISRFRGRAIGRRVKELMTLGLEAERLGMRLAEADGTTVVVGGSPLALGLGGNAGGLSQLPGEVARTDVDMEHQQGLEGLLEGMGISFG